jgi:hypothetical protein
MLRARDGILSASSYVLRASATSQPSMVVATQYYGENFWGVLLLTTTVQS